MTCGCWCEGLVDVGFEVIELNADSVLNLDGFMLEDVPAATVAYDILRCVPALVDIGSESPPE